MAVLVFAFLAYIAAKGRLQTYAALFDSDKDGGGPGTALPALGQVLEGALDGVLGGNRGTATPREPDNER